MAVTSAKWVDADHTSVKAVVNEQTVYVPYDPGNRFWQEVVEWEAAGNTIEEADPVVEPALENLSKNLMWERMTEEEADQADVLLRSQTPKVYRQYEGATYISTKAELYPLLTGGLTQLFGAQRAAEILEPNF